LREVTIDAEALYGVAVAGARAESEPVERMERARGTDYVARFKHRKAEFPA
jgi:hypothetical protein